MFSVSLGGGKYSLSANRVIDVFVKWRVVISPGRRHDLTEEGAAESKPVKAWERDATALLLTTVAADARVDAYICIRRGIK